MIDIKKLAYNIKSSNTSLRKMNGVLDNRLIMNQCKCMHHDGNGGVPLSALDEEELKKVPTPGVGIWKNVLFAANMFALIVFPMMKS